MATTIDVPLKFECLTCGSKSISVEDQSDDDSAVTCASCGQHFGTYGEVKDASLEFLKQQVNALAKKTFKGI